MDVAVRISHGELALAANALGVVVTFAVHAVHAHLGFWICTILTLDTGPPALRDGTADAVEAVGTRLALGADISADRRGVRSLPARHTLAIRGSVGVLADWAFDTL